MTLVKLMTGLLPTRRSWRNRKNPCRSRNRNANKAKTVDRSIEDLVASPVSAVGVLFEYLADLWMTDGFARRIRQEILLGYIGDVFGFGIFGKKVVEWLVFARTALSRNSLVPFFGIVEFGVDIENDAAK